ncbi:MAG: insulinase family protein [Anaeromyxobacter sp.]
MTSLALSLSLLLAAAPQASRPAAVPPPLDVRVFTLPNGLTVMLHPDHRLPQVTLNTWFQVGSRDEAPGRTGFAHLFEHLMFMGTKRVPGNQFDVLMESGAAPTTPPPARTGPTTSAGAPRRSCPPCSGWTPTGSSPWPTP